jgi:RimJ/RimL family protein N-acetyltransferase
MNSMNSMDFELKVVTEFDAGYILQVRNMEKVKRFLPPLEVSMQEQVLWIRENPDKDTYFLVIDKKSQCAVGTISLYNFTQGVAEWGRWVVTGGIRASVSSVYLLFLHAFEKLNVEEVYSRTLPSNKNVVSFHRRIASEFMRESNIAGFQEHRISANVWPQIKSRLERLLH